MTMKKLIFRIAISIYITLSIFPIKAFADEIDIVTSDSKELCSIIKPLEIGVEYESGDCIYNESNEVRKVLQSFEYRGDESRFLADDLTTQVDKDASSNDEYQLNLPNLKLETISKPENEYQKYFNSVASVVSEYEKGLISFDEAVRGEEILMSKLISTKSILFNEQDLISYFDAQSIDENNSDVEKIQSRVTSQETRLCALNVLKCNKAYSLSKTSNQKTDYYWMKYTHWQGNGDSYRHSLWNALMYKHLGSDFTYKMGLAHEGLAPGYNFDTQSSDTRMDIHNNRYGRDYGKDVVSKWPNFTDNEIAKHMHWHISRNTTSSSGIKPRRIRVHTKDYSIQTSCDRADSGTFYSWQHGYCTKWTGWYVNTSTGGSKL